MTEKLINFATNVTNTITGVEQQIICNRLAPIHHYDEFLIGTFFKFSMIFPIILKCWILYKSRFHTKENLNTYFVNVLISSTLIVQTAYYIQLTSPNKISLAWIFLCVILLEFMISMIIYIPYLTKFMKYIQVDLENE